MCVRGCVCARGSVHVCEGLCVRRSVCVCEGLCVRRSVCVRDCVCVCEGLCARRSVCVCVCVCGGVFTLPCEGDCSPSLQVYKSTADVEAGRALYERYSEVTDTEPERFLSLRDTVLLRKEARKMFVQANTRVEGGDVILKEYSASAEGLIRSFVERFQDDGDSLAGEILEHSRADSQCWSS
uniref:Uncharacterized protein n=1 Tax=Callorhinchus milii TaxID=7868 RepID=A0A4W3GPW2_CALMI